MGKQMEKNRILLQIGENRTKLSNSESLNSFFYVKGVWNG